VNLIKGKKKENMVAEINWKPDTDTSTEEERLMRDIEIIDAERESLEKTTLEDFPMELLKKRINITILKLKRKAAILKLEETGKSRKFLLEEYNLKQDTGEDREIENALKS
jgi:hypothetical protein